MTANQNLQFDGAQLINEGLNTNEREEINQSKNLEQKIDNYEAVREMYPYKLFKKKIEFNFLGKDVAVAPGQMGRNGSSNHSKGLPSPLGCWVLPTSSVWVCAWQNNILAWVRRMEVVSHQDTSCWIFRPLHLLVVSPKLIVLV